MGGRGEEEGETKGGRGERERGEDRGERGEEGKQEGEGEEEENIHDNQWCRCCSTGETRTGEGRRGMERDQERR